MLYGVRLSLKLLDDLVHICNSSGLLDLIQGLLVPFELLFLHLGSLLGFVLFVDRLQSDVVLDLLLVIQLLVSLLPVLLLHVLLLLIAVLDLFGLELELFLHKLLPDLVLLLKFLKFILSDFLSVLGVIGQ